MSDDEATGRPAATERPVPPIGFWADLRDAVALRTVLLVVGVLAIQLAFIWSYVGAFHHPTPHRVSVDVVASGSTGTRLASQLNRLPGQPVRARVVPSEARARARLGDAKTSAVLLVNPRVSRDTLLITSGGGTSVASDVEMVMAQVEQRQHRQLDVRDFIPTQSGDARGLTGFYLVIGWMVGGYLVASLLGVARGARPATARRAAFRLGAVVPYAIVSGLGGALIVGPLLGALTGHTVPLWWLGALLVFAAAAVTIAFQVLFGVIGIGVAVLLFVVLGNPSAGGAFQLPLLPAFWRAIGPAIPTGAGTEAVRRIVYFGAAGIGSRMLVLAAYAVAGVVVAYVAALLRQRRRVGVSDPVIG